MEQTTKKEKNYTRAQRIERSIVKTYRKEIWKKFVEAIHTYDLIQEHDRIAVCISGGKDSMLLAKCMQELHRHGKKQFELVFLVMDPGYNEVNHQRILDNAATLEVPIEVFHSNIFDVVTEVEKSPCYLCARMRRGFLYSEAKKRGCNKIALGHHFDDAIETTLMSMFYGAEYKTMMPKLHSSNFEGMELIRPLYLVKEEAIVNWVRYNELQFIQCACRFTENCSLGDNGGNSKRQEMKTLIKRLRKTNPNVDINIFRSLHKVNLETIMGWTSQGTYTSFLDVYDQNQTEEA
ncbi:MAG: tRNA 2-thiocytidine biosynthesis TtcA family protein [Erysipelotrichaceae bacterium]